MKCCKCKHECWCDKKGSMFMKLANVESAYDENYTKHNTFGVVGCKDGYGEILYTKKLNVFTSDEISRKMP